jgi:carboxymethylenebutenolidase
MSSGKSVTFSSSSGPANGWLVRPGAGRPGVIVLQEWWGLVPHVKDLASRFAALVEGLDWGRALQEIAGAIRYLRDSEGVERVGVAGFCMGGALTMLSATLPGVDAYAAFYGFPPAGAADLSRITAPGIIFFGEEEGYFSIPDAKAFAERQRAAGRECEVVVYPGAGHAFFNDTRPEVYRRDAANDAWRRTLDHFGRHLRPQTIA